MNNAEVDYSTCPYCGDRIAYRWNNGLVSERGTDLIADWVYHSVCWDEQIRRFPPDSPPFPERRDEMVDQNALVEKVAEALFDRLAPDHHMLYTHDDPQYERWRDMARVAVEIMSPQPPASPSQEGGMREALSIEAIKAALDKWFNGDRWREDNQNTKDVLIDDMRSAIDAALAHDGGGK